MSVTNISATSVELSAVGPLAVATVAATPESPDVLDAIVAAVSSRSAKLSASMTQLLLETQSDRAPAPAGALDARFRPKR